LYGDQSDSRTALLHQTYVEVSMRVAAAESGC
jgi:hypothetical protein